MMSLRLKTELIEWIKTTLNFNKKLTSEKINII